MLLTGGTTPWKYLNTEPVKRYPGLSEQLSCDVLIVGGGISGALMAYVLTKQGVGTVLLEKNAYAKAAHPPIRGCCNSPTTAPYLI